MRSAGAPDRSTRSAGPPEQGTGGRGRLTRVLRVVLAVAVAAGFLWPQVDEGRRALDAAADIHAWLLAVGAALQAMAFPCQAMLTRSMLPQEAAPGFAGMLRLELAAAAASHTIPGGTAAGTALGYTHLTRAGVSGADAGFAVAARGIGSALVINGLLWIALVVSIPLHGFDPLYTIAALAGALLLGAVAMLVPTFGRWRAGTIERVQAVASKVPFVDADAVPSTVARVDEQLRALMSDRALLVRATGWSAGYWLLAAASLWVFLAAFGSPPNPVELVVAFGLANLVAFVPLTPRGLGTLEFTLVTVLRGFGVASGTAALGVLAWRLVNFWAPVPVGGAAYLSLEARPLRLTGNRPRR